MDRHSFISYSAVDAAPFAERLCDALTDGSPSIPLWLDKRRLIPGADWDEQIVEAIRSCDSLIFVMSMDSVAANSACKNEWMRALRYKKPIIPVRFHSGAEIPFRLLPRKVIDFTGGFESGLAQLRHYLDGLTTPAGVLQSLRERLADAERDLSGETDASLRARIQDDIHELKRQVADQQQRLDDPLPPARPTGDVVAGESQRKSGSVKTGAGCTIVNKPPVQVPSYFQDRFIESSLIANFLKDDASRLMTITGRGGIGKTALACRVLKGLEHGLLPDNGGALTVDAIVYLGATGLHGVTFPNLFADLLTLQPKETATRLETLNRNPQTGTGAKMQALLAAFPVGRVVLLLDGIDEVMDEATLAVRDQDLNEALDVLLGAPDHALKVILTTRIPPRDVALMHPTRQVRLDLDQGLSSPYFENALRALDADGRLGLRDAPDALLARVGERTRGIPRALELLFGILSADRLTSLDEILDETARLHHDELATVLVGEAFNRLDPAAQQVLQALAIYRQPVPAVAVDYLLAPYLPGFNCAPVLQRLVNMHFARRAGGRYHLHPVDRDYAMAQVPAAEASDADGNGRLQFTQSALLHRGADYFMQVRLSRENWKSIQDLAPQLAEFDLRSAAHEYDVAARLLLEIDDRLFAWGLYSIMANLHERLQGKLTDPQLRQASTASHNRAHRMMGRRGLGLRHTLRGHEQAVTRIAWALGQQVLVSASLDGTIRSWNVETGAESCVLRGHHDRVFAVAVTPDGKRVVSASADKTLKVWDLGMGSVVLTMSGHSNFVTAVALLPDGRAISASWDATLKIWDLATGLTLLTLAGHSDRINAVAVAADGRTAVSASWDKTIKIWDLTTGMEVRTLSGHTDGVNDIVIMRQGELLVSGSEDHTIRLWNARTGQVLKVLEGHTAYVTALSLSSDARLLASKAADGSVRIWDCEKWETVAILSESSPKTSVFAGLSVSSSGPIMATLGDEDKVIRIWDLDYESLLDSAPGDGAVRYTTVKIALLGDSGVGKTGLGWRLTHDEFREQSSTHGQQFWVVNPLRTIHHDDTECEVVLWDFAGQPDYRLIHVLFLDDLDLALILFDPTERDNELKAVQYWLNHLRRPAENPARAILVGGRIDRGMPTQTPEDLDAFCHRHGVSGGYVGTSAATGDGVPTLLERIIEQVGMEERPATVTTRVFSAIKQCVLGLREKVRGETDAARDEIPLLASPEQLSAYIASQTADPQFTFTYDELIGAVGHLAKHGFVTVVDRPSAGQYVLLAPDLLNNLAASFVLEARRNNLGLLNETRLLRGDYRFQELTALDVKTQEILIDAATRLFLKNSLCFRKAIHPDTFLVFPALINQKRPPGEDVATVDDMCYGVEGAVETVYSTLVVKLGLTNTFTRADQWQNQAQYEARAGEVCGFRQIQMREGELELVLYYGVKTSEGTRLFFQGLFEMFLGEHEVTVTKYPPVVCPNCGLGQERSVVVRRMREGRASVSCEECSHQIPLPKTRAGATMSVAHRELLHQEQSHARAQTKLAEALVPVKRMLNIQRAGAVAPRCFISYAWGVLEDERWAHGLASDLRDAGVTIVLDKWDNPVGRSIARFISSISQCDFTLVIGTPQYKQKYENTVSTAGSVVAAEGDVISFRLIGTESAKESVLPLLLNGEPGTSFPVLLHGRVFLDFRKDEEYSVRLFELVIRLFGVSLSDPSISEVWRSLQEDTMRSNARGRL